VESALPKVCGVDSRFHGNDWGLERPCLANDTTTAGSAGSFQAKPHHCRSHMRGRTCALNLHGLTCILCACWHWFSVKVSVRTVADPSCPRTCLTPPAYDGAVGKAMLRLHFVNTITEESPHPRPLFPKGARGESKFGYQPNEIGERS
jgi:hypothetical protein